MIGRALQPHMTAGVMLSYLCATHTAGKGPVGPTANECDTMEGVVSCRLGGIARPRHLPLRLTDTGLTMQSPKPNPIKIGYLVHRIERLLQREIQTRLSHLDITFSMFHFLRLLLREDGRKHKEITAESGLTPSTTASAMKSLERADLISRRRGTQDSREIYVYLTPKALALRDILDKVSNEVIHNATRDLTPEQIALLQDSLFKMANALEVSADPVVHKH